MHPSLMIKVKHKHIRVINLLTNVFYVQQEINQGRGCKGVWKGCKQPQQGQTVSTFKVLGREHNSHKAVSIWRH